LFLACGAVAGDERGLRAREIKGNPYSLRRELTIIIDDRNIARRRRELLLLGESVIPINSLLEKLNHLRRRQRSTRWGCCRRIRRSRSRSGGLCRDGRRARRGWRGLLGSARSARRRICRRTRPCESKHSKRA
jgi:hypothetical protein